MASPDRVFLRPSSGEMGGGTLAHAREAVPSEVHLSYRGGRGARTRHSPAEPDTYTEAPTNGEP